jgi:hypothetical protein
MRERERERERKRERERGGVQEVRRLLKRILLCGVRALKKTKETNFDLFAIDVTYLNSKELRHKRS